MKPGHLRALAVVTAGGLLTGGVVALIDAPAGAVSPLAVQVSGPPSASSATPTVTIAPSPTGAPSECSAPATLAVSPPSLVAGNRAQVTVTATSNSSVRLFAAGAPSTSYTQVREAAMTGDSVTFSVVPGTNTLLYAQQVGCDPSDTTVVKVSSAVGISAARNGTRSYTFSGGTNPRRPGQLVAFYRVTANGPQVLTARVRTDSTGRWTVRRTFTGSGRFGFVARTLADDTNGAGGSLVRSTLIY